MEHAMTTKVTSKGGSGLRATRWRRRSMAKEGVRWSCLSWRRRCMQRRCRVVCCSTGPATSSPHTVHGRSPMALALALCAWWTSTASPAQWPSSLWTAHWLRSRTLGGCGVGGRGLIGQRQRRQARFKSNKCTHKIKQTLLAQHQQSPNPCL